MHAHISPAVIVLDTIDNAAPQVLRRFEQTGSIPIQGAATIAELAEVALEDEGFDKLGAEVCPMRFV